MSITADLDRCGDLTLFLGLGDLDLGEIIDSLVHFYRFQPTAGALWDLRRAGIGHLRAKDILLIKTSLLAASSLRPGVRMAVVTRGKLDYGIARMSQGYMYDLPLEVMAFREMDPARSWLGRAEASFDHR